MRNTAKLSGLIVGLGLSGLLGNAQEDKKDLPNHPPKPEQIMQKFDTDKNGSLNKTEVKFMHDEKVKKMAEKGHEIKEGKSLFENFDLADTDKNGEISLEELKANLEHHNPHGEAMFEKFDINKDNKLDKNEAKAMKDEQVEKMAKREENMKEKSLFARFDQIDTDKDGHITGAEMIADRANRPKKDDEPRQEPTSEELVNKYDTNKNGTIEKEEAKAKYDAHLAKMEEHKKHTIYDEFDAIDTNKDGFLTKEELKAFKESKKLEHDKKIKEKP